MAAEIEQDGLPTSRSPSPASRPPVPAAPGPRASTLQKLYNDAVAHVLKTCNYNNFSACFPTASQNVPATLKNLHEQFTGKLGESMRTHFDEILEDRHVISSLNELDGLIEDAKKRKGKAKEGESAPVPPHTLPAQQLYIAHLAPFLQQYSIDLKQRQDAVQAENAQLLEKVMQQRREIGSLVKGLETVFADLEAGVASFQVDDAGLEDLRSDIRDADERMKLDA